MRGRHLRRWLAAAALVAGAAALLSAWALRPEPAAKAVVGSPAASPTVASVVTATSPTPAAPSPTAASPTTTPPPTPAAPSPSASPTRAAASSTAAPSSSPTAAALPAATTRVVAPPIVWKPIVFGTKRRAETADYCLRHYGSHSYVLAPKVIVLHFTGGSNWLSTWNYFARDVADPEFHELPGPVAHFIVNKNGTIYQLIRTTYRGRHTYGLNYVAIGIEFVQEVPSGYSAHWADLQILNRKAQITAGLRLVKWLQATYHISLSNVIGHSMARSSPYYKDLVRKTVGDHGDWQRADVLTFRARLAAMH
jgi:N-acetylmuramoyl-L-alanine amidase